MDNKELINKNPFLSSLKNRLGYNSTTEGVKSVETISSPQQSTISGVNNNADYLKRRGGYAQQDRMITDKRKTLDRAVKYSYQAALVKKVEEETPQEDIMEPVGFNEKPEGPFPALINPNKLKQDYDDKIISIGYEYDFHTGNVFEWYNTNTYWLIYLQDLTELAYFRGDIRKCRYQINWQDEKGLIHTTYAAVRGPVETKINFLQKNGISLDTPNNSLELLLPKSKETITMFKRYAKFFLGDLDYPEYTKVWRVEASDNYSMPGILVITAVEYYINKDQDDTEGQIVGGLTATPLQLFSLEEEAIIGEGFIKPKKEYIYTFDGAMMADWVIDSKADVITSTEIDEHTIKLKWNSSYSGQFTLSYGTYSKTIVVESLF